MSVNRDVNMDLNMNENMDVSLCAVRRRRDRG
jgi:hypothetical protein